MFAMLAALVAAAPLPDCTTGQLSLATDGENGAFNGMSHGGTLLVLRNIGPAACRVAGLPTVTFRSRNGATLPIEREAPRFMHPGPAVVPVEVAAGAEVTTPLRWVSGPVYPKNRCLAPAAVAVTIGQQVIRIPFGAQMCGPAGQPVRFEQPPLRPDPGLPR